MPFQQGQELYEAAPGPKRFVRIPDGRHNDDLPREYWDTLDRFLGELSRYGMTRVSSD